MFQSRQEAEEADHARPQAKQERVAKKERVKWKKEGSVRSSWLLVVTLDHT